MKKIVSCLLVAILVLLGFSPMGVSKAAEETDSYIMNDAYVSNYNGQSNTVMLTGGGKPDKHIVGKGRHAYMRINIAQIDEENLANAILYVTQTHDSNNVIVTQTSEYLRNDAGNGDSETKWDETNITYNNRPIDLSDSPQATFSWDAKKTFSMDLTELLLDAKQDGKDVISIHITTEKVDDSTVAASEIYSTRSSVSCPYLEFISINAEEPQAVEITKSESNYLDGSLVAQKIFRIKNQSDQYLSLGNDNESIETTTSEDEAAVFALYTYQYAYPDYELEAYGATVTTYAIKCLDNNKFLTFQNYFYEDDASKDYYNLISDGKYEMKAEANEVNYNERFYIDYYSIGGYYTIKSHLLSLRDDTAFTMYPVQMTDTDGLYSSTSQMSAYKFQFEDVEGYDQLEVLSKVDGKTAILSWYPVNGDLTTTNYTVEGATITADDGKLYATVENLAVGKQEIMVQYENGVINQSDIVSVYIFNHPGITHSEEELDAMKIHIENKEEPWYSDYEKLKTTVPDSLNSKDFTVISYDAVGRGTPVGHGNISDFEKSANAAYFNALQWVITGDDAYANTVVNILNAWSDLKILDGRDRILGAAINSFKLNNAAEIVRYYNGGYAGFSDADFASYQSMMLNVIYPVVQDLGAPMIANGNWDTAAMVSVISIGILCDNEEIFSRAVNLYQDIHINGSIAVYVSDSGQSVESARDQAHAQLGIGYMADLCAAAFHQGINLWDLYEYRLAKAFNWAAQYNLYDDNYEFTPLMNVFGNANRGYWTSLDSEKINRGELRPVYELPLSYYSKIEGMDITWMKKAAEAMRTQGFVHSDNLNFGTLTTYNGENNGRSEPYFQLRTRLEPWYQRTYTDVKKYDSTVADHVAETLNSYFTVSEDGSVVASVMKEEAPYFQLMNNGDGTYAIRCVTTNTYLSVKDETIAGGNVIKADAKNVSENEIFILKSTGTGFYYLSSPKYDNRIVTVNVENESEPTEADLTMMLGTLVTDASAEVTNYERFILVYNTSDKALENVAIDTEIEKFNVTFETAGGSAITTQIIEKDGLITEPAVPTKEGYIFDGWYKENTFSSRWNFQNDKVTETTILYAKWNEIKVSKIIISGNDSIIGVGTTNTLTAMVEPTNATVKNVLWSSSDSNIATVSTSGIVTGKNKGTVTITATSKDGNGTVASIEIIVGYKITYKLNGGTNNARNLSGFVGNKAVKLQTPTRTGYTFKGWYTDKKFKTKITQIKKGTKKNVTVYAKWEKITVERASIKSVTNSGKSAMKVTINVVNKVKGYEIIYATDKKFKENVTTVFKNKSATIKNLTKGSTYYVKVRAYKVDSSGNKVYGKYSSVKTVKIKK